MIRKLIESSVENTIRPVLDYIMPRTCHVCGRQLSRDEKFVCNPCIVSLPRTGYHAQPSNRMGQRFDGIVPYVRATGHFFYSRDSALSSLIHDFKYRRYPGVARLLGEVSARELLTTGFLSDIDYIVPLPIHILKLARRGYNQSDKIAEGISEVSGIPVSTSLRAVRGHSSQTSRTLAQRRRNISGVFMVRHPDDLKNKHILIVDDVCTTGSTLTEAAEVLIASVPGVRISLFTLGVTF